MVVTGPPAQARRYGSSGRRNSRCRRRNDPGQEDLQRLLAGLCSHRYQVSSADADEISSRYLLVAIHRATRWVFLHIYHDMTDTSSTDFLRRLKEASPIKTSKILTDDGSQFTGRFTSEDKKPSGRDVFEKVCAGVGMEHRLAPPRHPQTNGLVERFNGRFSELLQQTRFDSQVDLEKTLHNYLSFINITYRSALSDQKNQYMRSKNGSGKSQTYL